VVVSAVLVIAGVVIRSAKPCSPADTSDEVAAVRHACLTMTSNWTYHGMARMRLPLAHDDAGYLYAPDARQSIASLDPDQVIGVEALLVLRTAATVLGPLFHNLHTAELVEGAGRLARTVEGLSSPRSSYAPRKPPALPIPPPRHPPTQPGPATQRAPRRDAGSPLPSSHGKRSLPRVALLVGTTTCRHDPWEIERGQNTQARRLTPRVHPRFFSLCLSQPTSCSDRPT